MTLEVWGEDVAGGNEGGKDNIWWENTVYNKDIVRDGTTGGRCQGSYATRGYIHTLRGRFIR